MTHVPSILPCIRGNEVTKAVDGAHRAEKGLTRILNGVE